MATFDTVDQSLELDVPDKDVVVTITMSDADQQTVLFQQELGSPGSGAWQDIKVFDHGSATVTYTYRTRSYGERLRLYLYDDDGGTNTVTLTAADKELSYIDDPVGNREQTRTQAGVTETGNFTINGDLSVGGDVAITGAVTGVGQAAPVTVLTIANDTDTLAVDADTHAGKLMYILDATLAVTLPEATGTGNTYTFMQGIAATASTFVTADTTNADIVGAVLAADTDDGSAAAAWACPSSCDTVTFNGVATGGKLGDWIRFTDIATDLWLVEGVISQSGGSEATPFSSAAP